MSFSDRKEERDDFWDLDKLVPKKKSASLSPFITKPTVKDYTAAVPKSMANAPIEQDTRADDRKLNFEGISRIEETSDRVYYPENSLIKSITVRKYKEKYDFYDSFRKAAILYHDCPGEKCEFAQFYSYMPQYAHLTPSQRSYYLYWRSELRRGRYIRTDYSYLYLYVYEILNLPDKVHPREGIRLLCNVWREYRRSLPRLDMYFPIWIEDYCLVHELSCPVEHVGEFLFDVIGHAPLKEFYLGDIKEVGLSGIGALLAYLSDYDWRKGRYASAEGGPAGSTVNSASYKAHMTRAMYLLLSEIWDSRISASGAESSVILRDAFPNTLCTHSVKCKLEIEYMSLSAAEALRRDVTAAVRYTENKLRALLGVKSRLATPDLPPEYRAIIDRYFDSYMQKESERRKAEQRPAYEKLYEAPDTVMSSVGADEIERMSWATTARLVADGDDAEDEAAEPAFTAEEILEPSSQSDDTHAEYGIFGLGDEELDYIEYLLGRLESVSIDTPVDSLAERINDAFAEGFGDIILEVDGDGHAVIEDYREDVEELICRRQR